MKRLALMTLAATFVFAGISESQAGLFDWFGKKKESSCCEPEPECCAPAPTCCAPAPTCCAPAPTCCAPAPTCCAPAPTCAGSANGNGKPYEETPPLPKKAEGAKKPAKKPEKKK